MARKFFIIFALLALFLIVPAVILYINFDDIYFDVKCMLNKTSDNTSVLIPSDNGSLIDNSTIIVDASEPAPSSKYALYDTFSSDTGLWQKNNRVWNSGPCNTTFQAANVYLSNGNLVLYSNNDKHIGGEIVTKQKYSYGKYRASIKTATLNAGCFETFYSYIWSPHNEIDGPELWKHDGQNGPVMVNENSALGDGSDTSFGAYITLSFDPSEAYHVYGYNWYPDMIEFVIDDKVVATTTQHVPNQPMNIYFQNWVFTNSKMPKDHGNGQNYELVDWVTYEPCTS